MDIETKTPKRKRLDEDEESDDEKQEKRPRLEPSKQHNKVTKAKDITVLSQADIPLFHEIDDKESTQNEPEPPGISFAVTESKEEKENLPEKSEICILSLTECEVEDNGIEIDNIAHLSDDLKDEVLAESDAIRSSSAVTETERDDECLGKDTQAGESGFGNKSETEKGGDFKFDQTDSPNERENSLDNCLQLQVANKVEVEDHTAKGLTSPEISKESEVTIGHEDVPDAEENECNTSVSSTGAENQPVSNEKSGQEDYVDDEERYLYRLLKPGDSWDHVIQPKDPGSETSIDYHVSFGSRDFVRSKYISCSKTRSGIRNFAAIIKRALRSQLRYIVRIDKTKLGDDCEIIDLTNESVRIKHLHSDSARKHSLRFDEVLLAPSCEIPVECITKVATVQHGTTNWIDDTL